MTITLILMHCQVIWDAGQANYFSCFYHTHMQEEKRVL